jgi:heptaprenylglyceryl phosphate synthase
MTSPFAYAYLEVLRDRNFDEIAVGGSASIERTPAASDIQRFEGSHVSVAVEPSNAEWIAASHASRVLSSLFVAEICDVPQF